MLTALLRTTRIEPAGDREPTARWRSVIVTPRNDARVVLRQR